MPVRLTFYAGGTKGVQRMSISLPEPLGPLNIRDFLSHVAKNQGKGLAEIESCIEEDDSRPTVLIALNGRNIHSLQGMDTLIRDGDDLSVLPVVAGG